LKKILLGLLKPNS